MKTLNCQDIFSISDDKAFEEIALKIFDYQFKENRVYSAFARSIGKTPEKVSSLSDIPFLPVSLFRDKDIVTGEFIPEKIFLSSGTTSGNRSKHHIKSLKLYEMSFEKCFRFFYGDPRDYSLLALLPSYLEQGDSSLVYMAEKIIEMTGSSNSGFFLDNTDKLVKAIDIIKKSGGKIILLGVSYALVDLSEKHSIDLKGHIVMETGGMKGRKREIVREELHNHLISRFNIDTIHSEYGMTELLSQAYSESEGIYKTPPWMKVLIRDPLDPFSYLPAGRSGGVNIIDLANIHSCSFIETSDIGILNSNGSFRINGRFDHSDIRGCNLLAV